MQQQWAEGPPPVPVADCIRDLSGCYLEHGHWINMTSATNTILSCGFANQATTVNWINLDFAR